MISEIKINPPIVAYYTLAALSALRPEPPYRYPRLPEHGEILKGLADLFNKLPRVRLRHPAFNEQNCQGNSIYMHVSSSSIFVS